MSDENEVIHYGVRGMKWGKRKDRQLSRARNVADGTASRGEKLQELNRTSGINLIKGNGLRGAAANRVTSLEKQKVKAETRAAASKEKYGNANLKGKLTINALKTQTKYQKQARDGKGFIGFVALSDKYTWGGNGRHERFMNKQIDQANADIEKIKAGETFLNRSGFTR